MHECSVSQTQVLCHKCDCALNFIPFPKFEKIILSLYSSCVSSLIMWVLFLSDGTSYI
jgi:hypothetical protein